MARYRVLMTGLDEVKRNLDRKAAKRMKRNIDDDLDDGIHEMAENSYRMAPVETGALRSSILASVRKISRHYYIYGSHLPYAQRQEYEHKLLRGYFRNAVRMEEDNIQEKIVLTIKRNLGH